MKKIFTSILLTMSLLVTTSGLACDKSTINSVTFVDNGNGTKTYTINISKEVGALDGYDNGFALLFGNSLTTKPIVITPTTLKISRSGFNDLIANYGSSIGNTFPNTSTDYFFTRYGNRADVLTYETNDDIWGFGTTSYNNQTIVVTVYGLVETITLDGDFRSSTNTSTSNSQCLKVFTIPNATTLPISTAITATITGTASYCEGNTASTRLSVAFAGGTPPYSFAYSVNGSSVTVNNVTASPYTLTVAPSVTSEYKLLFVSDAKNTGVVNANAAVITVNKKPIATVSNVTTCNEATATLIAKPSTGVATDYSYAWTVPTGVTAPGNVAYFSTSTLGTYAVTLTNNITKCVSNPIAGTITTGALPAAPTANTPQTFCPSKAMVSNLVAIGTGGTIVWYDVATGGTALTSTTALVSGKTYYAAQTVSGCESTARTAVTISITETPVPAGNTLQNLCGVTSATIASLKATAITGGTINWYNVATGGTTLSSTTLLAKGSSYYFASQTVNGCESLTRLAVSVLNTPEAPIATAQKFCTSAKPTVANLTANGTSLKWYNVATGGTALATTTALITGNYYVSQTFTSGTTICESTRTLVTVNLIDSTSSITLTSAIGSDVQSVCSGKALNNITYSTIDITGATFSGLPTGVTGIWANNIVTISGTPSVSSSFTYTIYASGGCGSVIKTGTINIGNTNSTTPIFNPIPAICTGGTLTALPTTSTNGITGTWSPALDSTKTTTYTFTPNAGQCTSNASITITVKPLPEAPAIDIKAFCNTANVGILPTSGLTLKWYSSATGVTALATSVPVLSGIYYASQVVDGCQGPRTAVQVTDMKDMGICNGNWTASNTTSYVYSPSTGQCATTATMTVMVYPKLITPTFVQVAAICPNGNLTALPTTSTNGITGTWAPALDKTKTTTYTFTPTAGQFASTAIMTIEVTANLVPIFTQIATINAGDNLAALPTTSLNGIAGTWAPAINNMATTTYTFTPTSTTCGAKTTMTIKVISALRIKTDTTTGINVKAIPNPYNKAFKLDLVSGTKEDVLVTIYDLNGKQIQSQNVSANNLSSTEFGQNLASGVYTINVKQGAFEKTVKVIKAD